MEKKTIICPLCGKGKIESPFKKRYIDIQHKSKIAKMLKKEGFSFRQIMRLFNYKSTASVRFLLDYKEGDVINE